MRTIIDNIDYSSFSDLWRTEIYQTRNW